MSSSRACRASRCSTGEATSSDDERRDQSGGAEMSKPRTARHVRLQPDSVLARRRSAIVAASIGQSERSRVPVVGPPNRVCGPGSRSPGIVPLGTPQAGPEWPPAGAVGRQAPVSEPIPPSSFIRRRSAASAFSVSRSVAWSSSISCPFRIHGRPAGVRLALTRGAMLIEPLFAHPPEICGAHNRDVQPGEDRCSQSNEGADDEPRCSARGKKSGVVI